MKPINIDCSLQGASSLILLDKIPGVTSFQSLALLKRQFGPSVGHAGTLDRFAQGLLAVLTGKLTKIVPLLTNLDKEYEAVFEFGRQTDTLDPEGRVLNFGSIPSLDSLEKSHCQFLGEIFQMPPAFSSVHVQGKRAYQVALTGEMPELAPRRISIHKFELLDWTPPFARVAIQCSKGTYVRALARDWALSVGSVAMVTYLKRVRIGPFYLSNQPREDWTPREVFETLNIPIRIVADPRPARMGIPPSQWGEWGNASQVALFDLNDSMVAVLKNEGKDWKYQFVCPA